MLTTIDNANFGHLLVATSGVLPELKEELKETARSFYEPAWAEPILRMIEMVDPIEHCGHPDHERNIKIAVPTQALNHLKNFFQRCCSSREFEVLVDLGWLFAQLIKREAESMLDEVRDAIGAELANELGEHAPVIMNFSEPQQFRDWVIENCATVYCKARLERAVAEFMEGQEIAFAKIPASTFEEMRDRVALAINNGEYFSEGYESRDFEIVDGQLVLGEAEDSCGSREAAEVWPETISFE